MLFLILCAVALALVSGAAAAVYHALKKYGAASAWGGAIAAFIAGTLVFPLPIHGGFMVLGAVLLHDFKSESKQLGSKREAARDETFLRGYEERFGAALDPAAAVSRGAVFDSRSGLLWAGPFDPGAEKLEAAKRRCAGLEPAGAWALPCEGEYYSYWKTFGREARKESPGRYLSYIVEESMRLELPTTAITRAPGPGGQSPASAPARIHCVARTAAAPARGYLNGDIPLSEWNRYQLEKMR